MDAEDHRQPAATTFISQSKQCGTEESGQWMRALSQRIVQDKDEMGFNRRLSKPTPRRAPRVGILTLERKTQGLLVAFHIKSSQQTSNPSGRSGQ